MAINKPPTINTPEINYQVYMMHDKEALAVLVKHCDGKIEKFFAALDKKIEKIVKAEVRRIMKK